MVNVLLFTLLSAAPAPPPSAVIAIVPPVTDQPEAAWVGFSLADDLETRLLEHSVADDMMAKDSFPVSVFGWRQMLSAARQANVNATTFLSAGDAVALGKAVGASAVFTATYWLKSSSIRIIWRLVGSVESKKRDVEIDLSAISRGTERVFGAILSDLELARAGVPFNPLPEVPLAAYRAHGQALEILRDQSLDPRARRVVSNERLQEAHALLREATTRAEQFQRAWAAQALTSALLGETARAAGELAAARANGPGDTPSMALAQFHLDWRDGQLDRAIVALGRALNTHLGFLLGLGYLGQAYMHADRHEEAVKLFSLYASRVPNNPWAGTMRAEALARMGRRDAARVEVEALARRFPDSLVVQVALAGAQLDAARYKDARRTLEKARRLAPGDPRLLARLAELEIADGSAQRALPLAEQAVKVADESRGEPAAGYPYLVLGRSLALLGREADAIEAFRAAAQLGVSAYELESLWRDKRLAEIVRSPRFPFGARAP